MKNWLVIIGIIFLVCIAEWMREIFTFRVTCYDIFSEKLNSMGKSRKIVFLSDLHNNLYGKDNKRLLEAIRLQKPDYILIGGDMLVGKPELPYQIAEKFVSALTKICPVYYANGNHEQRMKIYLEKFGTKFAEYKKNLEMQGVHFLENDYIDLIFDECPVRITGLEIPRKGYKKFKKTELHLKEVESCIGKCEQSVYQILLAHNPIYTNTYLEWGADLILSGHLHGGVVRIPGIGGIITPQFGMFPKYSGEHTLIDGKSVVVSKGLGTHTIKIRFLNPAEIVVLNLNGKDK